MLHGSHGVERRFRAPGCHVGHDFRGNARVTHHFRNFREMSTLSCPPTGHLQRHPGTNFFFCRATRALFARRSLIALPKSAFSPAITTAIGQPPRRHWVPPRRNG